MRIRLSATLAAGVAVLLVSGCSAEDVPPAATQPPAVTPTQSPEPAVPDLVDESCGEIARATAGAQEAMQEALADITTAPEAFSQVAANLRAAAADAGSEVGAAAGDLADVAEDMADKISRGDLLGLDTDAFLAALDQLATACGS